LVGYDNNAVHSTMNELFALGCFQPVMVGQVVNKDIGHICNRLPSTCEVAVKARMGSSYWSI